MNITNDNIPSYLQLAKAIRNLPKQDFLTTYDPEVDVFYINFHQLALPADNSELTIEVKIK